MLDMDDNQSFCHADPPLGLPSASDPDLSRIEANQPGLLTVIQIPLNQAEVMQIRSSL